MQYSGLFCVQKTTDLLRANGKQSYIEYTSLWAGFKLTTWVVIGADCTDSCKSNYHVTMTTLMSKWKVWLLLIFIYIHFFSLLINELNKYSEICLNRTQNKPKSCKNWTQNKPKSCKNWTQNKQNPVLTEPRINKILCKLNPE